MALESVTPPPIFHYKDGDDKCIEREDLEEGEIEDDEIPDEGVRVEISLPLTVIEWPAATTDDHKSGRSISLVHSAKLQGTRAHTPYLPQSKSNRSSIQNFNSSHLVSPIENAIHDAKSDVEGAINTGIATTITDGIHSSPENDTKENNEVLRASKRKRRKNKLAGEFPSRKISKKLKQNNDKAGEESFEASQDDDEMLFVRGASPVIPGNYSQPCYHDEHLGYSDSSRDYNEHYDDGDSKKYEICEAQRVKRGRLSQKRKRKELRKKLRRPRQKTRRSKYPRGKALQSTSVLNKTEICKFYLVDNCVKKDKCLYMHSDVPCKFYHKGLKCFAGDRCKFSHRELTETTKSLLHKHLDSAPKEMVGDFPQLTGEGAAAQMCMNDRRNKIAKKKIPSLLEIEVPIPPQLLASNRNYSFRDRITPPVSDVPNSDEAGSRTPMPSSPKLEIQNQAENFAVIQQWDMDQFAGVGDPKFDQTEQIGSGKKEDVPNQKQQFKICNRQSIYDGEANVRTSAEMSLPTRSCPEKDKTGSEKSFLPHNLPKKQRELFLRIQQQQRETSHLSSWDLSKEDETRDEKGAEETVQEENWYSSDEEDASLTDVLKNLSRQQPIPPKASLAPPLISSISTPSLNKLSASGISESVTKLLSNIKLQPSAANLLLKPIPTSQLSEKIKMMMQIPIAPARDPRLTSRDPRHRSTTTTMSSVGIVAYHSIQSPMRTTSPGDEVVTYCNSSRNSSIYSAAKASTDAMHPDGNFSGLQSSNFGGGDVDFRNLLSGQQGQGQQHETRRDVDLRHNMRPLTSSFSFIHGDMDFRGAGPSGDVDLREIMGLPFNPVPIHKPATEIDASLTSHSPFPYKIVPIFIPHPNYSGLKVNRADPHVYNDPRLCKLLNLSCKATDNSMSLPLVLRWPASSASSNDLWQHCPSELLSVSALQCRNSVAAIMSPNIQNPRVGMTSGPAAILDAQMVPSVLSADGCNRNTENVFDPLHQSFENVRGGSGVSTDVDHRILYSHVSCSAASTDMQNQRANKGRNRRSNRCSQHEQRTYKPLPRDMEK